MTSSAVSRPHLRLEKELLRGGVARLAAMDEVGRGALAGPVSVGVVVVTARIGRVPAGLKDSKLLTALARESLLPAVRRWAGEFAVGHASPAEIDAVGIIGALRLAGRRALAQLAAPVDAVLLDGNHNYLSEPDPTLFEPEYPAPADSAALAQAHIDAAPCGRPGLGEPGSGGPGLGGSGSGGPGFGGLGSGGPGLGVSRSGEAWSGLAQPDGFEPEPPMIISPVFTRIKADLTCAGVAGASVLAKTERDGMLRRLALDYPHYLFDENKGYGTPEHVAALRRHGPSEVHRRSWRLPWGDQHCELAGESAGVVGRAAEVVGRAAGSCPDEE